MKVVAFITDNFVVDRIINHLKLTFTAEKPAPLHFIQQQLELVAGERMEYP
jgi:hypothetical protein